MNNNRHTFDINSNIYNMQRIYNRSSIVHYKIPEDQENYEYIKITEHHLKSINSKLNYRLKINDSAIIESGLQYYYRHINSSENQSVIASFDYYDRRMAYYMLGNLTKNKLSFHLGIRAEFTTMQIDNISSKDLLYMLPSSFALYKYSNTTNIKFGITKKLSYPKYGSLIPYTYYSSDSLSAFEGNPDLKPEETYNFELKYTYKKKKNFISLTTYYHNKRNLIGIQKEILNKGTLLSKPQNYAVCNKPGINFYSQVAILKAIPFGTYLDLNYSFYENTSYNGLSYSFQLFTEIPLPFDMYMTLDVSKVGREYNLTGYIDQSWLIDEIAFGKPVFKDHGELTLSVLYPFLKDKTRELSWNNEFREEVFNQYYSSTIMLSFYYYFASGKKLKKKKRELLMEHDEK
ncbi:MAG: TonB-dependent receptor [Salinivirgaceae bacterium]|nr:TonB-dependent receptor [Salinivirgaceae bacterium]